jgi:hypothetical protein
MNCAVGPQARVFLHRWRASNHRCREEVYPRDSMRIPSLLTRLAPLLAIGAAAACFEGSISGRAENVLHARTTNHETGTSADQKDSIRDATAGAFANDTSLSEPIRAAIARSASRLNSSQTSLPSQLLVPGVFSAGQLPADAEGEWYAVTISGTRASLVSVHVHLAKAPNPRATGNLSIPGALVETDARDSVLFLVRGPRWIRPSPVPTWFLGRGMFSPGDTIPIHRPWARRWRIAASNPLIFPANRARGFRITIRDRTTDRSEELGGWQIGVSPEIQWVGDLDGDGRLDLFVSDGSSETGALYWTLYLSSLSKANSLLGKAAAFYTPGC